ncbi:MAG: EAL domain-containing protein [Sinobacterium sp.]|nr:EAL domain-containing protein [Sinobacterium sp.]
MPNKWVLESFTGQSDNLQRVDLHDFPMVVGRDPSVSLPIIRSEISRMHAEFYELDGQLVVKDLGSTNGTFVNHERLTKEMALRHGDILHFASFEFRVLEEVDATALANDGTMTIMNVMPLANKLPVGLSELQELLNERAIRAEFQPIVGIDGELFGYEVLGRGSRDDLPKHPMDLFRIAESRTLKAAELSELMRDCGVEQAAAQANVRLFLNTHPEELKHTQQLLKSMRELRAQFPDLPLVLEIHEDAVTDVELMKQVSSELLSMNVELAYDDFGAGQTRLMEMVEVPVAYVKFDIALIRGLHNAPESKRDMVKRLADLTKAMGIQVLAEGVEEPEELALCKAMNFDLIQGYYFGKPRPKLDYVNPLAKS